MSEDRRRSPAGSASSAASHATARDVLDYLEAPLRRPLLVVIPFVLVVVAAVASLFVLPKKYRSSTLILVESERVPESFVPKASTERTGRRLQTLRQEILSRTRLEVVARDLDPYGTLVSEGVAGSVERLRDSITVTVKGNDAFGVEVVHPDPRMAQKVANRITQLFIDQATEARKQQVSETYQFIETELEDSRRQLEKREEALRKYKEEHMGTLPEQLNSNLAALQRFQMEYQTLSDNLRAAMDRVAALENATTVKGGGIDPRQELRQLRGELASLRVRYTEEHPDVRALQGRIESLEKAIVAAGPAAVGPDPVQLEQARIEVRNLTARRGQVEARIGVFQARVEMAPRTEQELAELTRDFDKLNENYLALLKKKMDAQMATKLEQRWKGDYFRILDPANLPAGPYFPNPFLFVVGGILAGLAAGFALSLTVDLLDHSVRNVRELEQVLPFPVLAAVPFIVAARKGGSRRRPKGGTGGGSKYVSLSSRERGKQESR